MEVIKHRLEELKEDDLMLWGGGDAQNRKENRLKKTGYGSSKVSARQPVSGDLNAGRGQGGEKAWPRLLQDSLE